MRPVSKLLLVDVVVLHVARRQDVTRVWNNEYTPIFALYFRRISAFVFPTDFFAFPESPALDGTVDCGRPILGGAKDGRKADTGVLVELVEATACKNWITACFLDKTG